MNDRTRKTVLVTGATGSQGGAVARNLLSGGHRVRAFTRNTESESAIQLKDSGAEVVGGDFENPATITDAAKGADVVYVMGTPFELGLDAEVKQSIAAIDASIEAGVDHIIYTSVASALDRSHVPHFDSKATVEAHLTQTGANYTILAPVAFLSDVTEFPFWEGFTPGSGQGVKDGVYAFPIPSETPLQMVSLEDLGQFAQLVVENPSRFQGERIELASFAITGTRVAENLTRQLPWPVRYRAIPLDAWEELAGHDGRKMAEFFTRGGYTVDIEGLHGAYPEVNWHSVQGWLDSHDWSTVRG